MKPKDINELIAENARLIQQAKNETPEAKATQVSKGKLTARERISILLDDLSFVEIDALASHRKDYPESEKFVPAGRIVEFQTPLELVYQHESGFVSE